MLFQLFPDEIQRVIDYIIQTPCSPHFESNSFLFRPEDAQEVLSRFGGEDVTDVYRELESRDHGFRTVRIGAERTEELSEGAKNKAMVIKDYATGVFSVYDEFGRFIGIIPREDSPVVFSPSRFETVVERPLLFFNSEQEAIAHRLREIEQTA